MKTQFDNSVRVVSLDNLRAMCERISGVCHRYSVVKVSRSRVHVEYSNPDEYGTARPMVAVFPCYPSTFDCYDNPAVVIEYIRIMQDNQDGEGWQSFECLRDCPQLFRGPDGQWSTREEIYAKQSDKREKPSYWAQRDEVSSALTRYILTHCRVYGTALGDLENEIVDGVVRRVGEANDAID